MNATATSRRIFVRRPLSALGKLVVGFMLAGGILAAVGAFFIGFPGGVALAVVSAVQLLGAALVASGVRWTPALGAVAGAGLLYYALFVNPYPMAHFASPKPDFALFVFALLGTAIMALIVIVSLGALAQNYRADGPGARRVPRWAAYALSGLAGAVVGAILIAALAQPATTPLILASGEPDVHMGASNFAQSSVTVPVGSKLALTDDTGAPHILDYGSWGDGAAHGESPAGAPPLHDLRINNGTVEIGPFTTPGTYHIYCVVHAGMNLTVVVQ